MKIRFLSSALLLKCHFYFKQQIEQHRGQCTHLSQKVFGHFHTLQKVFESSFRCGLKCQNEVQNRIKVPIAIRLRIILLIEECQIGVWNLMIGVRNLMMNFNKIKQLSWNVKYNVTL